MQELLQTSSNPVLEYHPLLPPSRIPPGGWTTPSRSAPLTSRSPSPCCSQERSGQRGRRGAPCQALPSTVPQLCGSLRPWRTKQLSPLPGSGSAPQLSPLGTRCRHRLQGAGCPAMREAQPLAAPRERPLPSELIELPAVPGGVEEGKLCFAIWDVH